MEYFNFRLGIEISWNSVEVCMYVTKWSKSAHVCCLINICTTVHKHPTDMIAQMEQNHQARLKKYKEEHGSSR